MYGLWHPFCHTGQLINGMASGCPINNLIPEWNDLAQRPLATNNFPELLARLCPRREAHAIGIIDRLVTIKSIECAIIAGLKRAGCAPAGASAIGKKWRWSVQAHQGWRRQRNQQAVIGYCLRAC